MEAATVPTSPAVKGDRLRAFIGTYGLIAVLLALPVYFAIYDLVNDGDLSRIGNNLVDGISNGAIWALVAIGYTLVYGIVELINFAHGEVFMIGSFIAASMFATFGLTENTSVLPLAVALLVILVICMLGSGILNTMIERVGYRPLRSAPKLAPLITAVGFSFILQNVGLLWRGGSQEGIPDLIKSQHQVFSIVMPKIVTTVCCALMRSGMPACEPPRHRRPTFCRMKEKPTAVISGASLGALRRGL